MTTPVADRLYEAQHLLEHCGKPYAVSNPHEKPLDELPIIYGFNNGGERGWMHAQLLAQDGTALGSHVCTSEGYMRHDLGIYEGSRTDRHKTFAKHYPDGYRMDFVEGSDVLTHEGLKAAFKLNQEQGEKAKEEEAKKGKSEASWDL